ncbi:FHA domain-containing protein [Baaleninema sp.]|uniref:FHA domain-containing protein n=1 Tax=Baaleninema sp. TaxID=3101197 RepID=UPI003CFE53A3
MNGFGLDPIPGLQRLTPASTFLTIQNGPQQHREIALTQMRSIVGRNDPPHVQVDIDLTDCELSDPPMVSRRHAVLQWQNGNLTVRDLGSRNGTFIDGAKLELPKNQPFSNPAFLKLRSRIRFGNIELEVTTHD